MTENDAEYIILVGEGPAVIEFNLTEWGFISSC